MISSFLHFQFDMLSPQGGGKNINYKIYIYHNFHFYTHSCTSRFGGIIGSGAMKANSLSDWMRVVSEWYLGGFSGTDCVGWQPRQPFPLLLSLLNIKFL